MNPFELNRRVFLRQVGAASILTTTGIRQSWGADAEKPKTAADFVSGKDARLLAHNTKVGEIETPLELLREHRLTPKELLFIRNNQVMADSLSLQPAPLEGWKIELTGLLDQPRTIDAPTLRQLPHVEHEVVLQCSGNGRAMFSRTAKADGVQWQRGAMGNVRLKGVMLAALLDHWKVTVKPEAKFVTTEGGDSPTIPGSPDFEHSVPLKDALDKSFLVLEMNGEPLPRLHGGPVRFVVPGFFATMNVKWANRLRFEDRETTNHHQVGRYRTPLKTLVPGTKFTSTLENSEPNWNMKIKSVIFTPLDGDMVKAGMTIISGVAWNDGTAKIVAVEISSDEGKTWRRAELAAGAGPYAWQHWKLSLLLEKGAAKIQSRAIDALGRTQPLDGSIAWNPAGYAWNGVDEVKVNVG